MCKFYKLPFKYHLTLSAFYTISLSCEKALTNLWIFTHTYTHGWFGISAWDYVGKRKNTHKEKLYIKQKIHIFIKNIFVDFIYSIQNVSN